PRTMPQPTPSSRQEHRQLPSAQPTAAAMAGIHQPPYAYAIAEPATETTAGDPSRSGIGSTPTLVVERVLDLARAGDIDGAVDLLDLHVEYTNVGLPTLRGRERIRRLFRATLGRDGAGFDAYVHAIQLWVCGRFDVRDGQIVLWRDYFDYVAFAV